MIWLGTRQFYRSARPTARESTSNGGVACANRQGDAVPTREHNAGPSGHVYTVWPDESAKFSAKSLANWKELVTTPHYANVSLLQQPAAQLSVPVPVDLVFTSQNY